MCENILKIITINMWNCYEIKKYYYEFKYVRKVSKSKKAFKI